MRTIIATSRVTTLSDVLETSLIPEHHLPPDERIRVGEPTLFVGDSGDKKLVYQRGRFGLDE